MSGESGFTPIHPRLKQRLDATQHRRIAHFRSARDRTRRSLKSALTLLSPGGGRDVDQTVLGNLLTECLGLLEDLDRFEAQTELAGAEIEAVTARLQRFTDMLDRATASPEEALGPDA